MGMGGMRLIALSVLVLAVIVHASLPDLLRREFEEEMMQEEEKKTINVEEPEEEEEAKEEGKLEEEEVDKKNLLTEIRNFIDEKLGFVEKEPEMDAREPRRRGSCGSMCRKRRG